MTRHRRAVLIDAHGLLLTSRGLVPEGWTFEKAPKLPSGSDIVAMAVSPGSASVAAADLDRLPGLQLLFATSAGTDHLDLDAAHERGIRVASTRDYCTDEVADHTIALTLGLLRQTHRLDHGVRNGMWQVGAPDPRRIAGTVLGLWGWGAIARAVAKRALAVGMVVLVHARTPQPDEEDIRFVDWDVLLRDSDVLSPHVPLTEETRARLDLVALSAMRPGSYVVNTGRGGLIDEVALDSLLRSGHLAGAALDVLATEPPAAAHALESTPNLTLTPHAAWWSEHSRNEPFRQFLGHLSDLIN